MKKHQSTIVLGIILIGLSVILHGLHYVLFHDMHHLMIFLVADIAFIPLEVFFVSLVLERIIEKRDHEQTLKKLNMLVGLFYQKIGDDLLKTFVSADPGSKRHQDTSISFTWDKDQYRKLSELIRQHDHVIDIKTIDLPMMKEELGQHQDLIVSLISNPALVEHESFSDLLMSLFHLDAELNERDLRVLDQEDLDHLKVDIERVYRNLSLEWVNHMQILQKEYPYLFLTSVKNNPYDQRDKKTIEQEALASYQA